MPGSTTSGGPPPVAPRPQEGAPVPSRAAGKAPRLPPNHNPLQFVKVQSPLYKQAEQQIKLTKEVKITREALKEGEEEWQSNLDNWKSRRRKVSEKVIQRAEEMRQIEVEEQFRQEQLQQKRTKKFSEIVEKRSASRAYNLDLYIGPGNDSGLGGTPEPEDQDEGHPSMARSDTSEGMTSEAESVDSDRPDKSCDKEPPKVPKKPASRLVKAHSLCDAFDTSTPNAFFRQRFSTHDSSSSDVEGHETVSSEDDAAYCGRLASADSGLDSLCEGNRRGDTVDSASDLSQDGSLGMDKGKMDEGDVHVEEQETHGFKCEIKIPIRQGDHRGSGFTIRGGKDQGCAPCVDTVTRGGPADVSGLKVGDTLYSLNGESTSGYSHASLVFTIKQAVYTGMLDVVVWRTSDVADPSEEKVKAVNRKDLSFAEKLARFSTGATSSSNSSFKSGYPKPEEPKRESLVLRRRSAFENGNLEKEVPGRRSSCAPVEKRHSADLSCFVQENGVSKKGRPPPVPVKPKLKSRMSQSECVAEKEEKMECIPAPHNAQQSEAMREDNMIRSFASISLEDAQNVTNIEVDNAQIVSDAYNSQSYNVDLGAVQDVNVENCHENALNETVSNDYYLRDELDAPSDNVNNDCVSNESSLVEDVHEIYARSNGSCPQSSDLFSMEPEFVMPPPSQAVDPFIVEPEFEMPPPSEGVYPFTVEPEFEMPPPAECGDGFSVEPEFEMPPPAVALTAAEEENFTPAELEESFQPFNVEPEFQCIETTDEQNLELEDCLQQESNISENSCNGVAEPEEEEALDAEAQKDLQTNLSPLCLPLEKIDEDDVVSASTTTSSETPDTETVIETLPSNVSPLPNDESNGENPQVEEDEVPPPAEEDVPHPVEEVEADGEIVYAEEENEYARELDESLDRLTSLDVIDEIEQHLMQQLELQGDNSFELPDVTEELCSRLGEIDRQWFYLSEEAELLDDLTPKNLEPPREPPPPPPPPESEPFTLHDQNAFVRTNSTKRIKKEISRRRSDFLGLDGDGIDIDGSIPPPPPGLEEILKQEREQTQWLEKRLSLAEPEYSLPLDEPVGSEPMSHVTVDYTCDYFMDDTDDGSVFVAEGAEEEDSWRESFHQQASLDASLEFPYDTAEDPNPSVQAPKQADSPQHKAKQNIQSLGAAPKAKIMDSAKWITEKSAPVSRQCVEPIPRQRGYNQNFWLAQEGERRRTLQRMDTPFPAEQQPQRRYSMPPARHPDVTVRTWGERPRSECWDPPEPLDIEGDVVSRCSCCAKPLCEGPAMGIEALELYFHIECFRCCVCRIQLGNGSCGTDVQVKDKQLYCPRCFTAD